MRPALAPYQGAWSFRLRARGQFSVITAQITVPSNCTLNGPGKDRIILQSSVSLNASPISISNASHIVLRGFGVDGNRANNANVNDCLDLGPAVSDVLIDQLRASNCFGQGLFIFNGSSKLPSRTLTF